MAEKPYLLDTSVLLPLLRGKELGRYVDTTYQLRKNLNRHLICVVTHGEIWALAAMNGWGDTKRQALRVMLENLVTIDINDDQVIESYVALIEAARRNPKGSQTNRGENDLWIGAAARASGAILLTMDRHFDQFHPVLLERIYVDEGSRLVKDMPN